jgi:DNA repair exonuclease SbcCD ATPase subunit
MVISEIGIRGYKSFGNNEQVLKISTEEGQLVLLVGNNGNGKSSLLESFEYSLYGKVKSGKTKKWHKLGTLPNRINGELLNRIKFQSNGIDVEVKRGISPAKLELWENGVLNERAGKSNIDEKIEKYVGMDIETFKSFISMSINDFKNFISLTNEEKKLLLDKLFNLEVINILNTILKEINKDNKTRMATLDSEINTLEESISSIQRSIQKAIEKEKLNIQQEIDELMESMSSKKDEYKLLKEKVEKIKEKDSQLSEELDVEKRQLINIQNDIKNVNREINLYDSGKCPTCSTDFNTDHFLNLRATLVEKKEGYDNLLQEVQKNISSIKEKQLKLKGISDKTTTSFNDLNYLLRNYKSKIEELNRKQKLESGKDSVNVKEFEETINELEGKKTVSHEKVSVCKEKELYYKELNRILSEDGVKRSIISGIIKPINHFISDNIKKMRLPFEVKLDETFSAEIKSLGSVIEHDSLSTGETKKINIAILIAYLKLIRTKKHINILFLDEVFSSIDIEGIDSILTLLKSFANDYNINIFVVHHAILSQEMFDRIIQINKDVFSTIEEIEYEPTFE